MLPTTTPSPNLLPPVLPVPILDAVAIDGVKEHGKTRPLSMLCSSPGGDEPIMFVVKLYGDMDLAHCRLARELYGALLGQILGMNIPPIAIINISSDFYTSVRDQALASRLRNSPGYNFGSRLVEQALMPPISVPPSHLQAAADTFAFDMLIRNVDRKPDKSNMFQSATGYILFDHEEAFPYARPHMWLGGLPEPWDLKETAQGHFFYKQLKGSNVQFDDFFAKLSLVSDDFWATIESRLPAEWQSDEIPNIRSYLQKACNNIDKMKRGLQEAIV